MEVIAGYKETEVGVIPEDWVVKNVGEISDVKTGPFGSALHERDYARDGTPIITVEHLGEYGVEHFNLPLVSDADKNRLKAYLLRQGDVVFSRVGSVDRNALIKTTEDGWLFSGRLLRVRPAREISSTYLSYHFHSEAFKQRVRDVAVGQTMASINTKILMGVKAIIPPTITEQEAIAEALSDADALIEALEQLIAKKRDVKKGAMQELLSGKRRLPGFSGEWEVKRLGDIATYYSGGTPSTENVAYYGGEIPWITSSDLNKGFIDDVDGRITKLGLENSSAKMVNANTLLVALYGATAGVTAITRLRAAINQAVLAVIPNRDNCMFLFYKLGYLKDWIITTYTQGGQPNLSGEIVKSIEITLPEPNEQTAIAEILSDMDAEIAALEAKLSKARQVKQGMMQELLTGRIRLV